MCSFIILKVSNRVVRLFSFIVDFVRLLSLVILCEIALDLLIIGRVVVEFLLKFELVEKICALHLGEISGMELEFQQLVIQNISLDVV